MSRVRRGNRCKKPEISIDRIQERPVDADERGKVVLAVTIAMNALYMGGDTAALIHHLKDDHGMSFEQIGIGIDEIRSEEGYCFEDWEKHY